MGFTRVQLEEHYGREVPDLLPDPLRLLFVGINPSLRSAATGAHFSGSGNRFYPALHRAGITGHLIRAANGFSDDDLAELTSRGIGITNLWPEATARADELTREQLRTGRDRLTATVAEHRPTVVAVVGITAYRTAFGLPRATTGEQESPWEGTRLFAAPNPSGLNAHSSVDDLARAYGEIAEAAGIAAESAAG
ncbi:mismatch-specific DNA-glycosylase [Kocuria palustris]|jgi:TDG/mug DNA glycosylase family protein|uniref:mismatch-specific DNA-glycosylase n=1 Tax=Kocuria TaxID=57493 RepID=UPI0019D230A8|nr:MULTISPECIES: mismatch-specific DNA-glycosylase [Kocuria]MBN6751976.1 mismatch-specific DNA-glycosylase [Kocuria palustris]MBN6756931.1 mismatch-specific DNA-glycosylase [Kocuria palustris]MBN6761959.1 mismatch-specific DNA-glycosylase [Kocuria palustris]MBN6781441.1 mismatch-specific DNA-glycosylase [Kocuria palustris]MBN6797925.1 mismatch-specific DNA-glycosylase [Kocuria palustris]